MDRYGDKRPIGQKDTESWRREGQENKKGIQDNNDHHYLHLPIFQMCLGWLWVPKITLAWLVEKVRPRTLSVSGPTTQPFFTQSCLWDRVNSQGNIVLWGKRGPFQVRWVGKASQRLIAWLHLLNKPSLRAKACRSYARKCWKYKGNVGHGPCPPIVYNVLQENMPTEPYNISCITVCHW